MFNTAPPNPPPDLNHEGVPGAERTLKMQLYLACVSLAGRTPYENRGDQHRRIGLTAATIADTDPQWITEFVSWLRKDAGMRTAAIVTAVEAAYHMAALGVPGGRVVIDAALQRGDEPAEMLAYINQTRGRKNRPPKLPKPVKRGLADACKRLFTQLNYVKWNSNRRPIGMVDVMRLVHPAPSTGDDDERSRERSDLWRYMVRAYREPSPPIPLRLETVREHKRSIGLLKTGVFPSPMSMRTAGLTWENVTSAAPESLQSAAWEHVLPQMKALALLRNLRNFDKHRISDAGYRHVTAALSDPDNVRAARLMPLQVWQAYCHAGSRWKGCLEQAMTAATMNVPRLPGRNLILVDQSGSMFHGDHGWAQIAALFGSTLALRAEQADLFAFGSAPMTWWDPSESERQRLSRLPQVPTMRIEYGYGDTALGLMSQYRNMGGTDIGGALATYDGHDRVIMLTDEQATTAGYIGSFMRYYEPKRPYGSYDAVGTVLKPSRGRVEPVIPPGTPIHVYNLAGYRHGVKVVDGVNHFTTGGVSDAGFVSILRNEAAERDVFPFQLGLGASSSLAALLWCLCVAEIGSFEHQTGCLFGGPVAPLRADMHVRSGFRREAEGAFTTKNPPPHVLSGRGHRGRNQSPG